MQRTRLAQHAMLQAAAASDDLSSEPFRAEVALETKPGAISSHNAQLAHCVADEYDASNRAYRDDDTQASDSD